MSEFTYSFAWLSHLEDKMTAEQRLTEWRVSLFSVDVATDRPVSTQFLSACGTVSLFGHD